LRALPAFPPRFGLLLGVSTALLPAVLFLFVFRRATPPAVRGATAATGDLAPLGRVHGREAPPAASASAFFSLALVLFLFRLSSFAALGSHTTTALPSFLFLFALLLRGTISTAVRGAAAATGNFAPLGRVHGREAPALSSASFFPSALALVLLSSFAAMRSQAAPAGDLAMRFLVHAGEPAAFVVMRTGGPTVSMRSLAVFVRRIGVPPRLLVLTGLVVGRSPAVVVCRRFVEVSRIVMVRGEASEAADLRHVFPIAADCFAALSPRLGGFLFVPLVRIAAFMRRLPAFACDLALFFRVHRREAAIAAVVPSHEVSPLQ